METGQTGGKFNAMKYAVPANGKKFTVETYATSDGFLWYKIWEGDELIMEKGGGQAGEDEKAMFDRIVKHLQKV